MCFEKAFVAVRSLKAVFTPRGPNIQKVEGASFKCMRFKCYQRSLKTLEKGK